MESWVADACTLPTAQQPFRLAEFDALFAAALRAVTRCGRAQLRFTLRGDTDLAKQVRELVAREAACCSFFTFTVTARAEREVLLDVAVPADYVNVLDALADRAGAQIANPG